MGLRGGEVGSVSKLKKSLKRKASSQIMNVGDEGVLVRFLTEPDEWVEYFEHYDEANKTMILCSDDCDFCNQGMRASKRYLANVVDTEEGKATPLKLPTSCAQSLMKKYDRYATLLDRDYSILKEGKGMDTQYDVNPEPPTKFNAKRYERTDLWGLLQKMFKEQESGEDEDEDEEEAPRSTAKKSTRSRSHSMTKKKVAKRPVEDDEEDEDYEPPVAKKRRPVKKSVAKKKLSKPKF